MVHIHNPEGALPPNPPDAPPPPSPPAPPPPPDAPPTDAPAPPPSPPLAPWPPPLARVEAEELQFFLVDQPEAVPTQLVWPARAPPPDLKSGERGGLRAA